MIEVLVIVDVQIEFKEFIQYDLVDELHNYAENFREVYQIWDTHKTNVAPTYKFPNQIDSIKKLFGIKHFSDKVKEFTKQIEDESYEGRTFKLANNKGYVVRVDNNHDWFWVNPEIVELIGRLKNKKVILVGGADNECLEDVYQAFLAFGLNVEFNKKYVYSAKTDNDDSIDDKQVNESIKPYPFDEIVIVLNDIIEVKEFARMYSDTSIKMTDSLVGCTIEWFDNDDSVYFRYKIFNNELKYEGWGNLKWLIEKNENTYEKLFYLKDVKRGLFNQILTNGFYISKPTYQPKRIKRTLESVDNTPNRLYLNEISEESTQYKYRFKTEEEFANEFDGRNNEWYTNRYMWISSMNYLYGKNLEVPKTSFTTEEEDDIRNYDRIHHPFGNGFTITGYMVKENEPFIPTYKPKRIERTLESVDNKYPYSHIVVVFDNLEELMEYKELYDNSYLKISDSTIRNTIFEFDIGRSIYFLYKINKNELGFDGWCYLSYLNQHQNDNPFTYEKLFKLKDIKNKLFDQILTNGSYSIIPSYKPKKIERTLEDIDNNLYINTIEDKETDFKYRFKTEEEFYGEFGNNWRSKMSFNSMWVIGMDNLHGKNLELDIDEFKDRDGFDYIDRGYGRHPNTWVIVKNMVTENKPKITVPSYSPRRVVRTLEDKVLKLDDYIVESVNEYETKKNVILERIREHRYFMVYAEDKQNMLYIKNLLESSGIKHKRGDSDDDVNNPDIDTFFGDSDKPFLFKKLAFTIFVNYDSMVYNFETYTNSIMKRYNELFIKVPEELKLLNDVGVIKSASFMYKPKNIERTLESVDENNSYIYVAMKTKKDAYNFEKLLNDNNYIYFDEEETEDMIDVYDTAYGIEDSTNKYFIFSIGLDEKDYVLRVKYEHQIKDNIFYPKQKSEIMMKLNIVPIYKPKKINRKL